MITSIDNRTEKLTGIVTETLPNITYRVKIGEKEWICYLSGKMRLNKIIVRIGDRIEFIPDPAGGKATNRITKRL